MTLTIFSRGKNLCKEVQLIIIKFFFLSSAPAECKTWPTKDGGCCVFPFLYQGRLRDSCVFNDQLWCSITDNYDIDKMRGFCEGMICFRVMLRGGRVRSSRDNKVELCHTAARMLSQSYISHSLLLVNVIGGTFSHTCALLLYLLFTDGTTARQIDLRKMAMKLVTI